MSGGLLLLIVIAFALFFLFVIRPGRRRQNDQLVMQETLEVGDEIVTAGGLYGTVTALDDDEVSLEIADGVVVRVARRAVAGLLGDDEEEDDEPEEAAPDENARETPEASREAEPELEPERAGRG